MSAARLLTALAAAVTAAALAGCGSASSSAAPTSGAGAAASSSAAAASTASTKAAATTKAASAVDGKELCAFLTTQLPKIKAVGSKVGAQAQFAIAFFEWGEPKGLSGATQRDFDDAAKKECPALRDEIAAATGQAGLLS